MLLIAMRNASENSYSVEVDLVFKLICIILASLKHVKYIKEYIYIYKRIDIYIEESFMMAKIY